MILSWFEKVSEIVIFWVIGHEGIIVPGEAGRLGLPARYEFRGERSSLRYLYRGEADSRLLRFPTRLPYGGRVLRSLLHRRNCIIMRTKVTVCGLRVKVSLTTSEPAARLALIAVQGISYGDGESGITLRKPWRDESGGWADIDQLQWCGGGSARCRL